MPRSQRHSSPRSRPTPTPTYRPTSPSTSQPAKQPATQPATQPAKQPTKQPAKQPGLFGQMAATAGGVAAGSVIGQGISNMLWGRREPAPPASHDKAQQNPCQQYQDLFESCAKNSDLGHCQEQYNEWATCRTRFDLR